jgi:hypothetical protein
LVCAVFGTLLLLVVEFVLAAAAAADIEADAELLIPLFVVALKRIN